MVVSWKVSLSVRLLQTVLIWRSNITVVLRIANGTCNIKTKFFYINKMRLIYGQLLLGLLVANSAVTWAQSMPALVEERDKRAVTVDFGQFVRNLLLKSAAASETKANISRTVANYKVSTPAPRRPTTARTTTTATTTTTTPAAPVAVPIPFFFNKNDFFKFPFDLSGPINNKFNYNGGGYINFDYDDFVGPAAVRPGRRRRPTTTSTTTTTTTTTTMAPTTTAAPAPAPTAAPLPPRRIPVPRRPFGLLAKQKVPYYDYYNDYDYNYDDSDVNPAPATAAPTPAATAPAPVPASSPAPRAQKLPAQARVSGRIPQLRHRLVYQYRQPDDISINKAAANPAPAPATTTTAAPPPAEDNSTNDAEEVPAESAPTTNDYTDYTDNTGQDYNDATDNANADPNAQPNTLLNVDPNVAPNFEPNVTPNAANVPNVDPTVAPNNDAAAPLADPIADPLANPNADLSFNNDIGNINVPANYDFNAAAPYHDQFAPNLNDPSGIGNFIPPTQDFPFNPQQDFNSQYPLNTATHYSVRYY